MSISIKRIAAGLLASTAVLGAAVVGANPADALNPVTDTRFAGTNRFDTARQTALAAYPLGATDVVLARGDLFPDALAGSYLAGSLNGPVLLTESDSLHPEALAGLTALGATTVHLLGSEAALSANVRNQVTAAGFATTRIGGGNRYDTAAQVATTPGAAVVGTLGGFGKTAIVASGENFPDALAAGPIAHRADFPLLLTRPDSLPTETAAALSTLGIQHVLMIGGTSAVNDSVKAAIEATGVSVDRRFGPDRFATAANLAGFARTTLGWTVDELILATGFGFADAVSAGALGGVKSAPIVLTDDVLPAPSVQVCTDNQPTLTKLFVEGGPTVVTPGAVNACRIAGQGPVIVLPEPSLSGYVWADQENAPAYSPHAGYQYNSTGGTNTIVRNAAGDYTVTFPGLGVNAGTVNVTGYATNNRCKVEEWEAVAGGALEVDVQCSTPAGIGQNTKFTASFQRPAAGAGPRGYVWSNVADPPAEYSPHAAYQFNSTGATNTVTKTGPGAYNVKLAGLGGPGGHVQVTAYGSTTQQCKVENWNPSGPDQVVVVRCFTPAGVAADSRFTMTYVKDTRLISGAPAPHAYLWASSAINPAYTPNVAYQHSSSGSDATIAKTGVGTYEVTLPGAGSPAGGHVEVTSYGPGDQHCNVNSWNSVGGDEKVQVRCYDSIGASSDSRFTLAFVS